jgi:peptidoglycan/LPS O-acetylase OafA/YrhL
MGLRRYVELDSLRGIAALCVVLFHIFGNRSPTQEIIQNPTLDGILNLVLTSLFAGTGAVTLFFVLSGFVLAESLTNFERLNWRVYAAFITKRLFRLMPAAWASIGLSIILLIYFHGAPVPWSQAPKALLIDRNAIGPFNGPLWSINVEVVASAIFPFLLFTSRQIGIVGRIILLIGLFWATQHRDVLYVATYLFCFQFGIMVRELTGPVFRRLPAWAAHVLVLIATLLIMLPANISRLGYLDEISHVRLEGVGALLLIGYIISPHGERTAAVMKWPPLVFLGTISYSLYVFHLPIVGVLDHVAWRFVTPDHYFLAQSLAACFILPTAFATSYVGYKMIELPLQMLGRRLGKKILNGTGSSNSQQRPKILSPLAGSLDG